MKRTPKECKGSFIYMGVFENSDLTRVIALRQATDEVVSVGLFGSGDDDFHGSSRKPIGDVLLNRTSKKHWLLSNQRHLREQLISCILVHG